MHQIDINEAKIQLPALLEAAIKGAEIIVTENDQPLVRIAHISAEELGRAPGSAQEQAVISEEINGYSKPFVNLTDTEIEVMATAGGFLNDNLPDRFCAGRPQFDQNSHVWRVPVLLSYPSLGALGQAGEIAVGNETNQILFFTPVEEMKTAARAIIEQHREEIEAPLP